MHSGETALRAGTLIGPAQLGLIAALGTSEVNVYPRPRVGVLVTGAVKVLVGDVDFVGELDATGALLELDVVGELADVELSAPGPDASLALPGSLRWKARKMGETYRVFVYAAGKNDKAVLDSGSLGTGTEFPIPEGGLPPGKYEGMVQVRDVVAGYGQSQARFRPFVRQSPTALRRYLLPPDWAVVNL